MASDWNSVVPSSSTSAGSGHLRIDLAIGLGAMRVGVEIDERPRPARP